MSSTTNAWGGSRLLARLPKPTADRETRIAVISDPHVSTREHGGQRCPEYSEEFLARAVSDINCRETDGVVGIGDLTANGGPWDFEAVDDILSDLEPPFISIPGNHDVPATSHGDHEVLPKAEFVDRYSGGNLPFHETIGEIDLVGLDSMVLRDALNAGSMDDQIEWLAETLPRLTDPIVLLHHPLPGMTEWLAGYAAAIDDFEIERLWEHPEPLLNVLDDNDVSLVLTGHRHIPGIADSVGIREVMAPPTGIFPQGYLRLNVDSDTTEVVFVPLADQEAMQEAFLRRYNALLKSRVYASAGAVLLASQPIDDR